MTSADLALADDHLRRVAEAGDSYSRFDWTWKAFNVLYFPESRSGQDNRDLDRIKRTVSRVAAQAPEFFNPDSLGCLVDLPLIFDEKIWRDSGEKNNQRHRDVRRLLRDCGGRSPGQQEIEALAELLYVIRCAQFHGFKTPDGPRDQEVLDAAAPVLLDLVKRVRATWPDAGSVGGPAGRVIDNCDHAVAQH